MFRKIKLLIFLHKIYNSILKIRFIKALMTLISVLMSYKIIKFLWYFNKAFVYVLGLIFVGFNWSDYRLFTEIKLIYDSIILWFISFAPKNPVSYDLKIKTEEDIKEILLKDKELTRKNKGGVITDYRPYHISDNLENVQKVKKDIKHTYISDGISDWSISELIKDPFLIGFVAILILATGTIIVYKYDINVEEWTQWSWTNIKKGFVATIAIIGKIIQWFKRGGAGNPPTNDIPEIHEPEPDIIINQPRKSKYRYLGEKAIKEYQKGMNKDHEEFNKIYNDILPDIESLNLEIARIKSLPSSKENYINLDDNYKRLFTLYSKLPMIEGFENPLKGKAVSKDVLLVADSSENTTPKASTSELHDEIPFTLSPQPMSNVELEISPAKDVDNMTSYNGLTINEISSTYDKFLKIALFNLDEVKKFIKLRSECLDREHEGYNEAYENSESRLTILQEEMERLMDLPVDSSVLSSRKDCLLRFEQIFCQIPHKSNLGLIETIDTYNMHLNPDLYNKPDQPLYDIDAMDRYAHQLDMNLDYDNNNFDQVKALYGDKLGFIYNEIERLNYLPKNSYTNKALYDIYMKLIDLLDKYPVIDPVESIHKSPFIIPESAKTSDLLSIEDIPEL